MSKIEEKVKKLEELLQGFGLDTRTEAEKVKAEEDAAAAEKAEKA